MPRSSRPRKLTIADESLVLVLVLSISRRLSARVLDVPERGVYAASLPQNRECRSGVKSLCEKPEIAFLESEKVVLGPLASNKNAPYRKCGRRFFNGLQTVRFFTQALNAAIRPQTIFN
jgi:hypothetical protein